MGHLKRAGLFISSTASYTVEMCRGAYEACKEHDIELIIFFGGSIDTSIDYTQPTDYQKANIYTFANKLDLDFLLIPVSSICRTDQHIREEFTHYFSLPIITLNTQIDGYHFVSYDNKKGVKNAVTYMIEKNHCQHIGLITAFNEGITAQRRLQGYKEALLEHHYQIQDDYILTAPGYSLDPEDTIKKWLIKHPELDGIMCVTDHLAYFLYDELERLGKQIGKDVMVAGFDDLPESTHIVPPLASCHADASLISYLGVKNGLDLLEHGYVDNQYIDAHFIPRLSVDYNNHTDEEIHLFIQYCKGENMPNEYISQGMTQYVFDNKLVYGSHYQESIQHFFTFLLDLDIKDCTQHDVFKKTGEYINRIFKESKIQYLDLERLFHCLSLLLNTENYQDFEDKNNLQSFKQYVYLQMISSYNYLLLSKENRYTKRMNTIERVNKGMLFESLNEDIYSIADHITSLGISNAQLYLFDQPIIIYEFRPFTIPKKIRKVIDIQNNIKQETNQQYIQVENILSQAIQPYQILTTIYSNENLYGILVTDTNYYDLETLQYLSHQIGISLNVNAIVHELNNISVTDELTQIYNRRGLFQNIKYLYKRYKEKNENLYFLLGDLDNLKYINDYFGHDQGDQAIITVSHILKDVFNEHAVVGRLGGDEFGVVFTCKNPRFIVELDQLIEEKTEFYNQKNQFPFYVSLSYGISIFDYNSEFDLNHTISLADALMYDRKKQKHIQRGK